ncbi:MAG: hypothetical protein OCC49_15275 [Fibrobacterales bacterium]
MVKQFGLKLVLVGLVGLITSVAHARSGGVGGFMMYPTIMVLNSNNGEYTAKTNLSYPKENGTSPVPIEIEVYERTVDENGMVRLSKEPTQDYVAYPAQVVLMPGENKNVHIQWVGKNLPEIEKQYVVAAQQVPVKGLEQNSDPTKPTGSITAVVRYEAILVLTNENFKPEINTLSFKEIKVEGKKVVEVILENTGRASQKLEKMRFKVLDHLNRSKIIQPDIINVDRVRNGITAGGKRKVSFAVAKDYDVLKIKSVSAVFDIR